MPERRLTCCVCGDDGGRWQQHWNRDTGYGVCMSCVRWLRSRGTPEAEIADYYGQEGVNFGDPPRDAVTTERGARPITLE